MTSPDRNLMVRPFAFRKLFRPSNYQLGRDVKIAASLLIVSLGMADFSVSTFEWLDK